jgi:hypothetical protein
MLREIEISISRNMNLVEECIKAWPFQKSSEEQEWIKAERVEGELRPSIEKLSAMKDKFKAMREEAQALRDGVSDSGNLLLNSRLTEWPPRYHAY